MSLTKLDLLIQGKRNIVTRIVQNERDIKTLGIGYSEDLGGYVEEVPVAQAPQLTTEGQGAEAGISSSTPAIPSRTNLFQNSGFEVFGVTDTAPSLWIADGDVAIAENANAITGTHVIQLTDGASLSQEAPEGTEVPESSIVVSVFVRVAEGGAEGQTVEIEATHTPGVESGDYSRHHWAGGEEPTNELPANGEWHRIVRSFVLVGGATLTVTISQGGEPGTIEVDGAKLELASANGNDAGFIHPTPYEGADWGTASYIRNFSADNIRAGTLTVGGSGTNPRISVLDGSDIEIVVIGDPIGGYYGIEVKAEAGIRVSGSGSLEVSGGGSIAVTGGGSLVAEGDVVIGDGTNGIEWDADTSELSISAGSGKVSIDPDGLTIFSDTDEATYQNKLKFSHPTLGTTAEMYSNVSSSLVGVQTFLRTESLLFDRHHYFDIGCLGYGAGKNSKLNFTSMAMKPDNSGYVIASMRVWALGEEDRTQIDINADKLDVVADTIYLRRSTAGNCEVTVGGALIIPTTGTFGYSSPGLRFRNSSVDYGNFQGLNIGGSTYLQLSSNRVFDGSAWQLLNSRAGGVLQMNDGELLFYSFAASSTTATARFTVSSAGVVNAGSNFNVNRGAAGSVFTGASGSAGDYVSIALGRAAANEGLIAVAAGTGAILSSGEVAGDFIIRSAARIQLASSSNAAEVIIGNGTIGFLGASPVARQTGGALTAGATYTANEQTMLNRLWTMARNMGLIT